MIDHDHALALLGLLDQALGLLRGGREWLLDEDMLACLERLQGEFVVR